MTVTNKQFWGFLTALCVIAVAFVLFAPKANNAQAQAPSNKSDGECTGTETAGRCADKCPEGYFWRGGCVRVTGCPYGDSIPLDSPKCASPPAEQPVVIPPTVTDNFEGK